MANADDLKRLAEEMVGAYEERVSVISDIKQETANLIGAFGKSREEMAGEMRTRLAKFKTDLNASEDERKKDDQAEISDRRDYIMDLRDKAGKLIDEFGKAHGDMAQTLRAELAKFKSDLDAAEDERKKTDQGEVKQRRVNIENLLSDFDNVHQKMADDLRAELAKFKSDLDASEDERKKTDQGETREMAKAWKGLISSMQAARGGSVVAGPVEIEAAVEVKTVEEAIEEPEAVAEEPAEEAAIEEPEAVAEEPAEEAAVEEPVEEAEPEMEEAEGEDLGGRILDLIEDNPEGLKMTQIADMLDIENWRTLIPVMRELLNDEELKKEGTLYFPPE